jgi:diguanylate cyclase (GGDEF)-like protein
MYSMMALTVVSYTLYLSCSRETFNRAIIIFAVITFISLIFSIAFSLCFDPLFLTIWGKELTESQTSLMLVVNILFCTLLIFFFTLLFVMEINTVLKKLGKTNERLNYIATHDALTGLFNRHSLRELFTELESSDEEYCVIMGDIDDFKKVNDTYGHDCGDIVLKSVAEIIAKNLGVRDVACRWGGEEFLMIMRGTRDECFARISLVKAQINALKIDHEGSRVRVSMTFGFADCGENGDPPTTAAEMDSLISMVDKRLYKGKTSGKNVIVVQN